MTAGGGLMDRIGLQEAVAALRQELSASIREGAEEELRFQVGEITLEFQVEIERTAGVKGGIKLWVVDVGGEASLSGRTTHKVSVPLTPVGRNREPVLTGGGVVPGPGPGPGDGSARR